MESITDDYVSFEIAKLLKEKGFNELTVYHWELGEHDTKEGMFLSELRNSDFTHYEWSAPTQAHVLKWLRIKYNIHTVIHVIDTEELFGKSFEYVLLDIAWGEDKEIHYLQRKSSFKTPEEATEAAILYALHSIL